MPGPYSSSLHDTPSDFEQDRVRVVKLRILAVFSATALAGCVSLFEHLPYEVQTVPAAIETEPMTGVGDRADDPALWVDGEDPARSLILGTNKEEGLVVYDLDGSKRQELLIGQLNNVDLRGDVAVASNDQVNALSWFELTRDPARPVRHLGDTPVHRTEPYGVCLGRMAEVLVAGVTYKDGTAELWRFAGEQNGAVAAELQRTEKLASQLEGCVFDDRHQRLFIGEEEHGIWSLELTDPESAPLSVDTIRARQGLVADVEGLSLYESPDGTGFLVASAQAADRFIVYDRLPPHRVRGGFAVTESIDGRVDAVTHTDGLHASSAPLPGYPRGLVIVQDDGNPDSGVDQNFKLVDWRVIERALDLAVAED